jgi:hypothetical protein
MSAFHAVFAADLPVSETDVMAAEPPSRPGTGIRSRPAFRWAIEVNADAGPGLSRVQGRQQQSPAIQQNSHRIKQNYQQKMTL